MEKNVTASGDLRVITTLCIAIICGCLTMFVYEKWCVLYGFPAKGC